MMKPKIVASIVFIAFMLSIFAYNIYSSHCAKMLSFAIRKYDDAAIEKYLNMPWDVNAKYHEPYVLNFSTVLGEACARSNYYAVKTLLERGANPNLYDIFMTSPMGYAFTMSGRQRDPDVRPIADLLFEHGANIREIKGSNSPLGSLASNFFKLDRGLAVELTKYLISKGANYDGSRIIDHAAAWDQVGVIRYMLKDTDYVYDTSDSQAIIRGAHGTIHGAAYESVEYLLKNCPQFDKEMKDGYGKTAMDYAKENGDLRMMEILTGN